MSGDARHGPQRSDAAASAQARDTVESDRAEKGRRGGSTEWAARLALVVASLALTLLVLEGALRLLGVGAPVGAGDEDDGFTFFAHHPRLGWDLVPGAVDRHATDEFDVTIAITAQGLRESRVYDLLPAPGRQRVVVVGDSFTFGHGVEEPDGWTARLERRWDAVDVVNLAVTGYGTDQQLLRLEQKGLTLAPDLVVLGLFEGNVFRNARTDYLGYPKPRFELAGSAPAVDALRLTHVPVPDGRVAPGGWRLWRLVGARGVELAEHLGWGEAWPVTEALVRRMKASTEATGARLVSVLIPKDRAVAGSGLRRRLHLETLSEIRVLHERAGVPLLDLTPALTDAADDTALYYPIDGHWTAAGHAVAADAAEPFLAAALSASGAPTASDPRESLLP